MKSVTSKTAENHYDYLVRSRQLPELKRGGRVLSTQATTTNRTATTTAKLLRTHMTVRARKILLTSISHALFLHLYLTSSTL